MKGIRWQVFQLTAWLVFIYSIERYGIGTGPLVNLTTTFYALAAVTVMLILLAPLRTQDLKIVVIGILLVYALLRVIQSEPVLHGINKYLTLIEVGALLATAALTWALTRRLQDFQDAVEAIASPTGSSSILAYDKFEQAVQVELSRARRYQEPLSIGVIEPDPSRFAAVLHQAVLDIQASIAARYAQVHVAASVAQLVRDTDSIALHPDNGRLLLLAPATSAAQATNMTERLAQTLSDRMGIAVRYNITEFPSTALTTDDLLRQVTGNMPVPSKAEARPPVAHGHAIRTDRDRLDSVH